MDTWACIAPSGAERTRYGEIPKYPEGLYDLNNGLYAWMVPNGSWGESNAGLVVGDGASLLVDTLWDLKYTHAMLAAMGSLTDTAPLQYVVNTHADGDHWWGNQLVARAEIISTQTCYAEMLTTRPSALIMLGRVGRLLSALGVLGADQVGHWFQNMVAPYDFDAIAPTLPTRTFDGELTLDVGGREVQLIEVAAAHTEGQLIVQVPDAKTLFSGGLLFVDSTPVMWAGPVESWIAALEAILTMDVDVIVPGHGPVTDKGGVQQVKAYWEYVTAHVRQRYDAGMSAAEAAHDIVLSKDFAQGPFSAWNSPERMMTNVHIIYRHLQGRAERLKVPELLNILRKQALLAHALPDAQPAAMRKR
jgi:cyclase